MNDDDHGMCEVVALHAETCRNPDCLGPDIRRGSDYFIDTLRKRNYCRPCGERLRYHRRKAMERGEEPPMTFADVAVRLG